MYSPDRTIYDILSEFYITESFYSAEIVNGASGSRLDSTFGLIREFVLARMDGTAVDKCLFEQNGIQSLDVNKNKLVVTEKTNSGYCFSVYQINYSPSNATVTRVLRTFRLTDTQLTCYDAKVVEDKRNRVKFHFYATCLQGADAFIAFFNDQVSSTGLAQLLLRIDFAVKRMEAILHDGLVFFAILTDRDTLLFTKKPVNINNDQKLSMGDLGQVVAVESFDLMYRTLGTGLDGVELIYFEKITRNLVLLFLVDSQAYESIVIAKVNSPIFRIVCPDEYASRLVCMSVKASGLRCLLNITRVQRSYAVRELCNITPFEDFHFLGHKVTEFDIYSTGYSLTERIRRIIKTPIQLGTTYDSLTTGGVDLNPINAEINMNRVFVESLPQSRETFMIYTDGVKLFVHRVLNLTLVAPPKSSFKVDTIHKALTAGSIRFLKSGSASFTIPLTEFVREKKPMSILLLIVVVLVGTLFLLLSAAVFLYCYREPRERDTEMQMELHEKAAVAQAGEEGRSNAVEEQMMDEETVEREFFGDRDTGIGNHQL